MAVGFFLLAAVTSSGMAMTLGDVRGTVAIGLPLDVTVAVRLDGNEELGRLCFEAEVFHADGRINAARVFTTVLPDEGPGSVVVRVQSPVLVDVPVVTVYLREGCVRRVMRRYVLMADLVSAVAPAVAATVPASAGADGSTRGAARSAPASKARHEPAWVGEAPASVEAKRRVDTDNGKPDKPHLKLDASVPLSERQSAPHAPPELPPTEDSQHRAKTEAEDLRQMPHEQPRELAHDAQRLRELKAEVEIMHAQAARNQASLGELRAQLSAAETRRYANGLVYGLVALLAVALGYLAWQWRRWSAVPTVPARDRRRGGVGAAADADEPKPAALAPKAAGGSESDSQLVPLEQSIAPVEAGMSENDFPPSDGRIVNTGELLDVQQQAEFFTALEQHEEAIALLKNSIKNNPETSALAYLDLFKLYHEFGRREDYAQLREGFIRAFNAQVPPFDAFGDQSDGLEAYPGMLSRIEALWPSAEVLDVLEELIFRKPGDSGAPVDFEAYQELLLLHAVAKDLAQRSADRAEAPALLGPVGLFKGDARGHLSWSEAMDPLVAGMALEAIETGETEAK